MSTDEPSKAAWLSGRLRALLPCESYCSCSALPPADFLHDEPRRIPFTCRAPGPCQNTFPRTRIASRALPGLPCDSSVLPVRLAPQGGIEFGHVPADARRRTDETEQYWLAHSRCDRRHQRLQLVADRSRSATAGPVGQSAVAAVYRIPGGVRGAGTGGDAGTAGTRQAPAVHLAGCDLDRGAQDVSQEPLSGAFPGVEPGVRTVVPLQVAPFQTR